MFPERIGVLAAIPVIPLIAIAVVTAAGTFATTGRLIRWLPEASPHQALTATLAVATLALAGDPTVIALYLRSSAAPVQPLAVLAIGASLARITASVVTLRHATLIRRSYPPQPSGSAVSGGHDARR